MQRIGFWSDLVSPGGQFRYGSVTEGEGPTPIKAEWLNMLQEELVNVILAYLPALDHTDNTQLLQALRAFAAQFPQKADSLAGYGILDAFTKTQINQMLLSKAMKADSLAGYGISDAFTKDQVNDLLATKQDKNTALMAANGWRLDKATGLLEQWGSGVVGPDSTSAPINFPTPFAEVYNCFGNKVTPNSEDGDGNAAGAFHISATQYRLFNDTNTYQATVHWRALGKAPGY